MVSKLFPNGFQWFPNGFPKNKNSYKKWFIKIKNKSMHTSVIMHTNTYKKITYIFMLTLYEAYIIF